MGHGKGRFPMWGIGQGYHGKGATYSECTAGAIYPMPWGTWVQGCSAHGMGAVSCGDIRGAVRAMIWGCIIMGRDAVTSMARGVLTLGGLNKGSRGRVARCALVPLTAPTYQNPLGSCKHPKIQPQPERVNDRK